MPELFMEGLRGNMDIKEINGYYVPRKEIFTERSPRSPLSKHTPDTESIDLTMDEAIDTSIEQLYNNVCELQSSDLSASRRSFLSYGDESRIDSELRYLAGVDFGEAEVEKTEVAAEGLAASNGVVEEEKGSDDEMSAKVDKYQSTITKSISSAQGKGSARSRVGAEASPKPTQRGKASQNRPPTGKLSMQGSRKLNAVSSMKNERISPLPVEKMQNGAGDPSEAACLGTYLLKQAKEFVSSRDNPRKALEVALQALKSFENSANSMPNLDFVMCLHVIAALYCRFGRYKDAIPILERSIEIPIMDLGENHALAKFSGCMQLGDAYAMMGQIENSILCYTAGVEIQRQVLGEKDSRVGETCRYLAEAHVQALQFVDAEKLCQMALDIHKARSPASLEEAADRRLLGLIYDSKGDYEAALEHYVLASIAFASYGHVTDVAAIDCYIGDAYLSLARYDEAIFAYQKALSAFKSSKGDKHPSVASIFVRLTDLYNKIGQFTESKSCCENALRIYAKPVPGSSREEIANGLVDISAIYESLDEPDKALNLLKKAIKVYGNAPGQQNIIAGIEAQMGVLYYMLASYTDSYNTLKNAIAKFRAIGEKKSALFGAALNQMGLACLQLFAINEAADYFEEARSILEAECGQDHADTIGVYSNLAGVYDAMGRTADAIEILEFVVGMREEKLGTANPDVDDEKRRLGKLLKEAGRVRNRKVKTLETLLVTNSHSVTGLNIKVS